MYSIAYMQIGAVLGGRFELVRFGGTGGMAAVYEAIDRMTGEPVAIKVLRGPGATDSGRFAREARVLAKLDHPGIVHYVAHGLTPNGEMFLAMEWLTGVDLKTRITSQGRLTASETLALGIRVADALAAAHKQNVVHRDIKPSNLWLFDNEVQSVKIIDFGVARMPSGTQTATGLGMTVGTPGYMAPEQARGELEVDARADVFSLGCVLFECLVGHAPFTGEHVMAVLAKVLLQEAPHVREFRSDVPKLFDRLLARMLSKDPTERPANGFDVAKELRTLEQMGPVSASMPPSITPSLTRSEQRIVSVVLAVGRSSLSTLEANVPPDSQLHRSAPELEGMASALRVVVAPFGASFEVLSEKSAIALISGAELASDLALRAAGCAQALARALPDARVVVATGPGVLAERLPVGEVIDRAFAAIGSAETGIVTLDSVTSQLLSQRSDPGIAQELSIAPMPRPSTPANKTLLGRPVPFVGRDRELELLRSTWSHCVSEPSARAVVITAPAGTGKSRIRQEFLQTLWRERTSAEVILCSGSPLSSSSPFGMLAPALRRVMGIFEGESIDVQRYKLRSRVQETVRDGDASRVTEFLGELAGIAFPDAYSVQLRAARASALLMADQMRMAWLSWIEAECKKHPVLIVLEDLHWGDRPTVQLVEAALRALSNQPLLVLGLGHSELHHRFPSLWDECDVTELRLRGLAQNAASAIVQHALGDAISSDDAQNIIERAHGNAFYLEELIRSVHEGHGLRLPDTVFGMVQTRIEALDPEARRVLRAASVYGKRFHRDGAVALLGGPHTLALTERWLKELVDREVLVAYGEGSVYGPDVYAFRHELMREAAYAMLTEEDRVLGHRLAAAYLSNTAYATPAILADHFERGSDLAEAVDCYHRAALEALAANDLDGAIDNALCGLGCNPDPAELGALALVLAEAYRWKDTLQEAEHHAHEALDHLVEGEARWFQALGELMVIAGLRGHVDALGNYVVTLERTGARSPDAEEPRIVALCRAAWQLLSSSRYALADVLIPQIDAVARTLDAHSPLIGARIHRVQALRLLLTGHMAEALDELRLAMSNFEHAGDMRNQYLEQVEVGHLFLELGQHEEALSVLEDVINLATKARLGYIAAYAQCYLGTVLARTGLTEQGIAMEQSAITWFSEQGNRRLEGSARMYLADILLRADYTDDALAQAELAVRLLDGFASKQALAHATLAQVHLTIHDASTQKEALLHAENAIRQLERLGRLTEGEGRVRLVYAEALDRAGKHDEARDVLEIAYRALLQQAHRIEDSGLRHSFLRFVPHNYRALKVATEWGLATPTSVEVSERPSMTLH